MLTDFFRYFFRHIFFSRERQRLLILAVVGLFISAFALLVLQSTMGGLQHKLISRSKSVFGQGIIELNQAPVELSDKILIALADNAGDDQFFLPEYEIELLLRQGDYVSPLILHGQDYQFHRPQFLEHALDPVNEKGHLADLLLGSEVAYKMRLNRSSQVRFISPAHTDTLLVGEVPRSVTTQLQDILNTNVPAADALHGWVRLSLVQNLIRSKEINRIRLFGAWDLAFVEGLLQEQFSQSQQLWRLMTWEEMNQTLVWALRLETSVMVFLFIAMTMLVSLCITSGLMIFFNKIKIDLASFWIMGASRTQLDRSNAFFLFMMSLISVVSGLLFGAFALYLLDNFGGNIMPAGFVDRKIPVHIEAKAVLISFFVPFGISMIFSFFSLYQFKRDNDFLETVRSVG